MQNAWGKTKYSLLIFTLTALSTSSGCFVESVCYNDSDCKNSDICEILSAQTTGSCIPRCLADDDCHSGFLCENISGKCFAADCREDEDCVIGFLCTHGFCIAIDGLSCPGGMANIEDNFCIDRWEASRLDATATSEGSLVTTAISRAAVIPWRVVNNATAEAACVSAGKSLCTESQWQRVCQGPAQTVYSYGNNYSATSCNGIDRYCYCESGGCSSETECPYPHCYHDCSAGFHVDPTGSHPDCTNAFGVFDMNGNLWEHVSGGDETRIRGGAYNCSDSEALHRCDYIPTTWMPSARGFRCCSPGTPIVTSEP
ncbi:SUMF1/EgtB/PvdO family nonheme iron enzyme [Myxococcota bacterium]|nr:SUMF1/EgtB/PvdO family nonheme iron enzyme [Myxococcota bacterium]